MKLTLQLVFVVFDAHMKFCDNIWSDSPFIASLVDFVHRLKRQDITLITRSITHSGSGLIIITNGRIMDKTY